MKLALRELRRRPGRFVIATGILTLIALLLMFLGGLLDGLTAGSTGALRAQRGDLIVYSSDSQDSLVRSRITPQVRGTVEEAAGGAPVAGLGSVQLGARIDGHGPRDLVPVVLFGYESAPRGVPDGVPEDGQVYADRSLQAEGVAEGSVIRLGPDRSPVTVIGFLDDSRYSGQGTLWGSLGTWRSVLEANRPGQRVGEGVVQALVVGGDPSGATPSAEAIDRATGGATSTLTIAQAIDALPGVSQQQTVFNQIIGVTVVIALVVVALFFALITVERTAPVRRAEGDRGELGHPVRRRPAAGAGGHGHRLGHRRRGVARARRRDPGGLDPLHGLGRPAAQQRRLPRGRGDHRLRLLAAAGAERRSRLRHRGRAVTPPPIATIVPSAPRSPS